jgi:NMD protein affecting ribosome stability and mRNA decay
MSEIYCKECGKPHDEGTSLNGYCEKCVDRFIAEEEQKVVQEFKDAGVDLDNI